MGYLSEFEHDIFVSYAHSDLLNDWSRRLIEETRKLVAGGLGLRGADQVEVWWDYRMCGNEPLTRQLRENAERSAILLVLMSEWYLDSAWCRDEVAWFVNAVRQRRGDRVFVVRVCGTDDGRWPEAFKDERGFPLVGYDFGRHADDDGLRLPRGYPRPEDALDSREYYDSMRKLARDLVGRMKALKSAEVTKNGETQRSPESNDGECVFVAAAPAEDVDDLRDELAGILRAKGCKVVPESNPLDMDEVHRCAPEWLASCDKFVQILGTRYGKWEHDDTGLVMYQHLLAERHDKPIYIFRAPSVEVSRIKHPDYKAFMERFARDDTGGIERFAERVAGQRATPSGGASRSVFVMAGPWDNLLEEEIRHLMADLDISVFPLSMSNESARDVASIVDEDGFLEVLKRCGAIVLLAGKAKSSRDFWLDRTILYIEQDIKRKLGALPPYAVIDAPPPPPLSAPKRISVLRKDSPSFRDQLLSWLNCPGRPPATVKEAFAGCAGGNLN